MKFITLTGHRSGSGLLQGMLNSHPDIFSSEEELYGCSSKKQGVKILNDFFTRSDFKVVGFKVMYTQIKSFVLDFIEKNDIKIIQLIRNDLLETALWFGGHREDIGDGKFRAKIDDIIWWMIWLKKQIDKYRKMADFTIWYQDISGNKNVQYFHDEKVRKKLLNFLGVKNAKLFNTKGVEKTKRPPSEKCVVNYQELLEEIKNIPRYYDESKI